MPIYISELLKGINLAESAQEELRATMASIAGKTVNTKIFDSLERLSSTNASLVNSSLLEAVTKSLTIFSLPKMTFLDYASVLRGLEISISPSDIGLSPSTRIKLEALSNSGAMSFEPPNISDLVAKFAVSFEPYLRSEAFLNTIDAHYQEMNRAFLTALQGTFFESQQNVSLSAVLYSPDSNLSISILLPQRRPSRIIRPTRARLTFSSNGSIIFQRDTLQQKKKTPQSVPLLPRLVQPINIILPFLLTGGTQLIGIAFLTILTVGLMHRLGMRPDYVIPLYAEGIHYIVTNLGVTVSWITPTGEIQIFSFNQEAFDMTLFALGGAYNILNKWKTKINNKKDSD